MMNNIENKIGFILFGYMNGFVYHQKGGCSNDFTKQDNNESKLANSLVINFDNTNGVKSPIISYSHIVENSKLYSFFIKYIPSKDSIGRSAYQGVALVLCNSKLDSAEILNNLNNLMNYLESTLESDSFEYKIDKLLTSTLEENTVPSFLECNINPKKGFLQIQPEEEKEFIQTAFHVNWHKIYASSQNNFINNTIEILQQDFIENPSKYFYKNDDSKTDSSSNSLYTNTPNLMHYKKINEPSGMEIIDFFKKIYENIITLISNTNSRKVEKIKVALNELIDNKKQLKDKLKILIQKQHNLDNEIKELSKEQGTLQTKIEEIELQLNNLCEEMNINLPKNQEDFEVSNVFLENLSDYLGVAFLCALLIAIVSFAIELLLS